MDITEVSHWCPAIGCYLEEFSFKECPELKECPKLKEKHMTKIEEWQKMGKEYKALEEKLLRANISCFNPETGLETLKIEYERGHNVLEIHTKSLVANGFICLAIDEARTLLAALKEILE